MQANPQAVVSDGASKISYLVLTFVIAGAICSVIASVAAVYLLGWYDPKFERALSSAVQVQLLDMVISLLAAGVLFAIVVAVRIRDGLGKSIKLAALLGATYPIGSLLVWRALMPLDPESLIATFLAIAYVVLYPTISGIVIKRV